MKSLKLLSVFSAAFSLVTFLDATPSQAACGTDWNQVHVTQLNFNGTDGGIIVLFDAVLQDNPTCVATGNNQYAMFVPATSSMFAQKTNLLTAALLTGNKVSFSSACTCLGWGNTVQNGTSVDFYFAPTH